MFTKITTTKPEINAALDEIEAAIRNAKKSSGDLNWLHSVGIEVSESGRLELTGDPKTAMESAILGISAAKAKLEAAVKRLDELQNPGEAGGDKK